MKNIVLPAILAGIILLLLSYVIIFITIQFFPEMVEEYYNPVFWPGEDRAMLFYAHPFILSFALSWIWNKFKSNLVGDWHIRGAKLGIIYGFAATLPAMWITFSAMNVSFFMVISWLYGFLQAIVAGLILARMNP